MNKKQKLELLKKQLRFYIAFRYPEKKIEQVREAIIKLENK